MATQMSILSWVDFGTATNLCFGTFVLPHGNRDLDSDGAEAGGLIGFNYQWHNWIFGAEAAGGYLWLRDSAVDVFFDDVGDKSRVSTSFKTHYLFTFGPRIGYAFCRWLPYLTGGLALGDLEFDQSVATPTSDFEQRGSKSETNAGWMIGAGLEYALTNHWRVRGQYQYIDLGSVGFDSHGVSDFVTNPSAFTGHHDASLTEHNASFAIIYGF